jgi:quercetin dioxygenase-like cupin family protein
MRAPHPHVLALAVLLALPVHLAAQAAGATTAAKQPSLKWGPGPAFLPAGARMAVESGDPGKAGRFAVRLEFPNGYRIPPHSHSTAEMVRVRQGTFIVGMGDTFDLKQARRMAPGDTGTLPARMNHFAAARGRTLITMRAMGPFDITYVNPGDDPRTKAKPKR